MDDLNLNFSLSHRRSLVESGESWRATAKAMPFFSFPADWKIAIIPPFGGAMARFIVQLPSGTIKSIYFDPFQRLGDFSGPYWEVHPYQGDVGRCAFEDTDKVLEMIADESKG